MRKALLIGINDYDWAPLSYSVKDAEDMSSALSFNYNNNRNFSCKTYTSDNKKITRAFLLGAIKKLFAKPADVALFYFSGHGAQTSLGGVLVTQDGVENSEGVSVSDIITIANNAVHIGEVIVILDCCHSGHFGTVASIDKEKALLRKGITILTASESDEYAVEKKSIRQSLFTNILLEGIKGGAANLKGVVTASSLYSYAERILGPWDQRPVFKAHITKMTPISIAKPRITDFKLQKLIEYFESPEYLFPLDPSFEHGLKPKSESNEAIMEDLRTFLMEGLIQPVGYKYMYDAAKNSSGCKLTTLGIFYWKTLNRY